MRSMLTAFTIVALMAAVAWTEEPAAPASAEAQLKAAYAVKKQSHGKEGEEKRQILLAAVAAYAEVGVRFPEDKEGCATAAFRIGEIQRSIGEAAAAEKAFQEVLVHGSPEDLVARALLELGHLKRREKELERAIDLYGQVARQCPGARKRGATALLWIAKCHRSLKSWNDARTTLRTILEDYIDEPRSVISAYDLIAATYLDESNVALAEETLMECRERFQRLEADGGEFAGMTARVEKLKSWKRLATMKQASMKQATPKQDPSKGASDE